MLSSLEYSSELTLERISRSVFLIVRIQFNFEPLRETDHFPERLIFSKKQLPESRFFAYKNRSEVDFNTKLYANESSSKVASLCLKTIPLFFINSLPYFVLFLQYPPCFTGTRKTITFFYKLVVYSSI